MKIITFLSLITMIISSCNTDSYERAYVSGTYVNHMKNELGIASDTIIIQPVAKQVSVYNILRKTVYSQTKSNENSIKHYENDHWTGLYVGQIRSIQEINKQKVIIFFPKTNRILFGNHEYRKIKSNRSMY